MLFHLCIVFLLPYLLQVSSQSEEARDIVENARGLFNAVAKNESEMVGKFVSALRKNEEKLETAYDNLKKAMESSVRKHCHQPNFIQRNRAIKRGADSGLPDYEAEFRKIRGQMKNVKGETERKEYLLTLLVDCKAENKAEQKRANDAEKDKEEYEIPLQGVKMRGKMEELVNDFWPGGKGKPIGISYFNAMSDILKSPHPKFTEEVAIMEFRKVIEDGVGFENFLTAFKTLYSKFSNLTHVMIDYLHKVELPDYNEFEKIRKLLKNLGIREDKHLVVTISLTLKPAYLLPKREIVPPEEYRCVRLSGGSEDDVRELNLYTNNDQFRMTQQDIRLIFQTTNPQRVEFHYADKTLNFIKVYFENAKMAQQAHYEHNAWWKGIHLITEHVPCNGYKLNGEVKTLILQKTTTTTSMTPIA